MSKEEFEQFEQTTYYSGKNPPAFTRNRHQETEEQKDEEYNENEDVKETQNNNNNNNLASGIFGSISKDGFKIPINFPKVKSIKSETDLSMLNEKDELNYLNSIRFMKPGFVGFLRFWKPMRDYVHTSLSETGELNIVVDGPLFAIMMFEIYLLEIVNEVYFRMRYDYDTLVASAREKLDQKVADFQSWSTRLAAGVVFADALTDAADANVLFDAAKVDEYKYAFILKDATIGNNADTVFGFVLPTEN
jgi:hypothetical protein